MPLAFLDKLSHLYFNSHKTLTFSLSLKHGFFHQTNTHPLGLNIIHMDYQPTLSTFTVVPLVWPFWLTHNATYLFTNLLMNILYWLSIPYLLFFLKKYSFTVYIYPLL